MLGNDNSVYMDNAASIIDTIDIVKKAIVLINRGRSTRLNIRVAVLVAVTYNVVAPSDPPPFFPLLRSLHVAAYSPSIITHTAAGHLRTPTRMLLPTEILLQNARTQLLISTTTTATAKLERPLPRLRFSPNGTLQSDDQSLKSALGFRAFEVAGAGISDLAADEAELGDERVDLGVEGEFGWGLGGCGVREEGVGLEGLWVRGDFFGRGEESEIRKPGVNGDVKQVCEGVQGRVVC